MYVHFLCALNRLELVFTSFRAESPNGTVIKRSQASKALPAPATVVAVAVMLEGGAPVAALAPRLDRHGISEKERHRHVNTADEKSNADEKKDDDDDDADEEEEHNITTDLARRAAAVEP